MYHKEVKPNPKKSKSARRKRNALYWKTGGRQTFTLVACPDCIKAMKEDRKERVVKSEKNGVPTSKGLHANIKCKSCKKSNEKRKKDSSTK